MPPVRTATSTVMESSVVISTQERTTPATATMTGGQALVASILAQGVDTIFALPGIQLDGAFDALYDAVADGRVRVIHPRHEQTAAYMADGYARVTGRIGTCFVVPGPGLLNASAALATAYACNSPVLCVTGQIQSDLIGVGRGQLARDSQPAGNDPVGHQVRRPGDDAGCDPVIGQRCGDVHVDGPDAAG